VRRWNRKPTLPDGLHHQVILAALTRIGNCATQPSVLTTHPYLIQKPELGPRFEPTLCNLCFTRAMWAVGGLALWAAWTWRSGLSLQVICHDIEGHANDMIGNCLGPAVGTC
jgi:hypothetical protein